MSLLVDMKSLLTSVSSDIFLGDLPDTPDDCLALYQSGGQDAIHSLGAGVDETHETPTFQVRIRNTSYATANTKAESVKDIIADKKRIPAARYYYLKFDDEPEFTAREVTTHIITNEIVQKIINALGRACGVVDTLLPQLERAARLIAMAA